MNMKLSPQVIADAEGWVEKNGLFPQPCGASIKLFCKFLGISCPTYQRWEKNISFLNAITRAREVFRQTSVQEVSNALIKAAKGVEFTKEKSEYRAQKITEYDPQTGKNIGIQLVYKIAEKVEYQNLLGMNVLTIRI